MKKIKEFCKDFDVRDYIVFVLLGIIIILILIILVLVIVKKDNKVYENTVPRDHVETRLDADSKIDTSILEVSQEDNTTLEKKNDTNTVELPSAVNKKEETTIKNNEINTSEEQEQINPLSIDEEVIAYMNEVDTSLEKKNLRESAKEGFITIVDFLFYDGKIKGHTFNELSNKAKLKVLQIALSINSKIDTYFPDYKEKISTSTKKTYNNVKASIVSKYIEITAKICGYDQDTCTQAKSDFQDMKKSFSLTWNLIKDIASSGVANVKEAYEIFSGK